MTAFAQTRNAAKAYWQRQGPVKRMAITIGMGMASLLILLFGVLLPMQEARQRLSATVAKEEQRTANLRSMRAEIERLAALPASPSHTTSQLRSAIEASARGFFSSPSIVALLEGENVKLNLENVSFERLTVWLDTIRQSEHVQLQSATIRPQAGNQCSAMVVLSGVQP